MSLRLIAIGAPTTSLARSPCGRLSNRFPNRRCLFSSWAVAGLSPDSIGNAPMLVVRKHPVVARASWFTRSCSSFAWSIVPWVWSPFHHSSEVNKAADWI